MKSRSWAVAFCALMAALGAALMAAGGLIPIATYCAPMIAAVLLIPVMEELGRREAWMVWAVTSALSLMLSADKEAAFLYLFLGYYPILRPRLDAIASKPLRFLAKLLFFSLTLGLMYLLLLYVLQLETLLEDFHGVAFAVSLGFYLALVAVMMIFDVALGRLHLYYVRRLRQRLGLPKK